MAEVGDRSRLQRSSIAYTQATDCLRRLVGEQSSSYHADEQTSCKLTELWIYPEADSLQETGGNDRVVERKTYI